MDTNKDTPQAERRGEANYGEHESSGVKSQNSVDGCTDAGDSSKSKEDEVDRGERFHDAGSRTAAGHFGRGWGMVMHGGRGLAYA